jgi:hypothetical protein
MEIKLGCDPEAFLIDEQGQLKSSIGLVGGSKYHPMPLPLGDGYAVQEDNVAIEFNIPPAAGRSEYVESINKVLKFLTDSLKTSYGLSMSPISAASFPESELVHPAAKVFGCDPDYNAWTLKRNPRPNATDKTLRSCGGHVHIGFDKTKIKTEQLIKLMDLFVGVPSVLMDKGELRKTLYGKAGAYRDKSYGGEYRTLSNFWVFNNSLIEWVWDNTSRAVNAAEAQITLSEQDSLDIVNCINKNDKELAQRLVEKHNLQVVYV